MLLLDQHLNLTSKEPQERVPVGRVAAELELAGTDPLDDLVLRQPELLPRCLVAERRALALPLGIHVVHELLLQQGPVERRAAERSSLSSEHATPAAIAYQWFGPTVQALGPQALAPAFSATSAWVVEPAGVRPTRRRRASASPQASLATLISKAAA